MTTDVSLLPLIEQIDDGRFTVLPRRFQLAVDHPAGVVILISNFPPQAIFLTGRIDD